ncbi:unnamed protein product, partial [Amoebophrya sp. A120]
SIHSKGEKNKRCIMFVNHGGTLAFCKRHGTAHSATAVLFVRRPCGVFVTARCSFWDGGCHRQVAS